jgi:hypothetical protein
MNTSICPQCGSQQDVPDHYLGRQIKCRQCSHEFTAKVATLTAGKVAARSSKTWIVVGAIAGALIAGGGYTFLRERPKPVAILSTNNKVTEVEVKRVEVSEMFRSQMLKFLESGSKMKALSEQGVSYNETRDALANVRAAWDMTRTMWPSDLNSTSTDFFEKSIKAWDSCLDLWKLKLEKKDMPTAPDTNGFAAYKQQFGDDLVIAIYDSSCLVEAYRGREHLPFDENISALLGVGTTEFFVGRDLILQQIK